MIIPSFLIGYAPNFKFINAKEIVNETRLQHWNEIGYPEDKIQLYSIEHERTKILSEYRKRIFHIQMTRSRIAQGPQEVVIVTATIFQMLYISGCCTQCQIT